VLEDWGLLEKTCPVLCRRPAVKLVSLAEEEVHSHYWVLQRITKIIVEIMMEFEMHSSFSSIS
jgi:hypothetical protein